MFGNKNLQMNVTKPIEHSDIATHVHTLLCTYVRSYMTNNTCITVCEITA